VDVGGYDPLLGLSYTEIAGRSRSMHKSQGFGAAETRGEMLEYLKLVKGDRPKTKDIFEGIDMTWGRVKGGETAQQLVDKVNKNFFPIQPDGSIPELSSLQRELKRLEREKLDVWWAPIKSRDVSRIIASTMGLVVEALSDQPYRSSADSMAVTFTALQRTQSHLELVHFMEPDVAGIKVGAVLATNEKWERKLTYFPGESLELDQPYWLQRPRTNLYDLSGHPYATVQPVTNNRAHFRYALSGEKGAAVNDETHVMYKWVDRVAGERFRPVYVTPVASVIPKSDVLIAKGGPKMISVDVEALTDSLRGELTVSAPPGWLIAANSSGSVNMGVTINKRNERNSFTVSVEPTAQAQPGSLKFSFTGPKGTADRTLHEIDYPHIMPQVYYTPAEVKLVPLDVNTTAKRVGYVKGAGDEVPQALEQLGVVVEYIEPSTAKLEELKKYDAIVTGIRAYNATKGMKELHPRLLQYVAEGGTLVVQYNTTPRFAVSGVEDFQIDPSTLGPHPFKITRDRVTVEEASPTFLDPKHPLLTTPNAITAKDFEGWVQERGLYFAGDLGDKYTPLIAWNDPGEQALTGGLITCDHGKGRFIYTGISFFRQLPAGVPGAYRLFANLISPRGGK
jgi:hypothetical protein